MKKLFLLLVVISQAVFAQSFNYSAQGDKNANEVLKNFIENEYSLENVQTVGYLYNNEYVIGIAKSNVFYTLEGYKLIVLKKGENGYTPVKCNVYFDNTKEVLIENNKITYYKSVFYKNRKYTAHIKNNEIKTLKSVQDKLTDKKVKKIENITSHKKNENQNNIELSDFKTNTQKNIRVKYNNLSDRTKHYLDMK